MCSIISVHPRVSVPGLSVSHFYHISLLETISVTICDYFTDPSLLPSFVEILFLRGPMILKYERLFATCPRAGEHCKLRLALQPRG